MIAVLFHYPVYFSNAICYSIAPPCLHFSVTEEVRHSMRWVRTPLNRCFVERSGGYWLA